MQDNVHGASLHLADTSSSAYSPFSQFGQILSSLVLRRILRGCPSVVFL